MYTDLDKADIVTRDKETGRAACHQTDHRELTEIESELDLSIAFALTRVLNGRRAVAKDGNPDEVDVYYVSLDTLPPQLVDAIHSAGGRVRLGAGDEILAYHAPSADVETLADRALASVARQVRERLGHGAFDQELLTAVEADIADGDVLTEDEDGKMSYWTHLIELAAVAGEVLRAEHGGRWVRPTEPMGIVPFVFELANGHQYNAGNKAHRFLDEGAEQSCTQLLLMAEDAKRGMDKSTVLVAFKPAGWPGEKECVCQPIFKMGAEQLPLMVYGYDQPNTFAHLNRENDAELAADLEGLHKQAIANLAHITDVEVKDFEVGPLKLVAVSGSYFAAEKILDAPFMRAIAKRLGAQMLAAGIPKKGLLLVMNGFVDPEHTTRFGAICAGYHRDGGDRALTPTPFIVSEEGEVQGVILLGGPPPGADQPAKKKGFFSRLFGSN
jgi:hypothetical protein